MIEIKKYFFKKTNENPQDFYPIKILKKLGFERFKCQNCNIMFYSISKRKFCGDSSCCGNYSFIENSPTKKKFSFCDVWIEFEKFMKKKKYYSQNRFPIVARFRDDLDFNIASIIGFQPYITKGIIKPLSNQIIIPQNCLRFIDVENVGYTSRHGTSFTMIGQLAFEEKKNYNQDKYFMDLLDFFLEVVGIPLKEIQIHEDFWQGGGDCGPSLEFFCGGLELANQVYMWYGDNKKELKLRVLDMGMGQERVCWLTSEKLNQYEATMPKVCEKLFELTKLKPNWKIYKKFLPYSGNLNLDEIDDIDIEWKKISKKININVLELEKNISPLANLYSIADHCRSLLYAFCDGALPSNVKGGYNLRMILRRVFSILEKRKWEIDLYEIFELHTIELEKQYPELKTILKKSKIKEILKLELEKYNLHKKNIENKLEVLLKKNNFSNEDFLLQYTSNGITPDEICEYFKLNGKKILLPQNFFLWLKIIILKIN